MIILVTKRSMTQPQFGNFFIRKEKFKLRVYQISLQIMTYLIIL